MKKQQYKKYFKSKRKVLGKPKDRSEVIAAIQLGTAAVISAIKIRNELMKPIPKYPSGGQYAIVGKTGKEMICIHKNISIDDIINKLKYETTQKH